MRSPRTTQSPATEARRSRPLAPCHAVTNDVSMDALFAPEVQFFVRRSGKLLGCPKRSNQLRQETVYQPGSRFDGKFLRRP
jgi:hypothetical protein